MSVLVPGIDGASAGTYPRLVDNEEPLVVLTVTHARAAFTIYLRVDEALRLAASLHADAMTIKPQAQNYALENAISTGEE